MCVRASGGININCGSLSLSLSLSLSRADGGRREKEGVERAKAKHGI